MEKNQNFFLRLERKVVPTSTDLEDVAHEDGLEPKIQVPHRPIPDEDLEGGPAVRAQGVVEEVHPKGRPVHGQRAPEQHFRRQDASQPAVCFQVSVCLHLQLFDSAVLRTQMRTYESSGDGVPAFSRLSLVLRFSPRVVIASSSLSSQL